MIRRLFSAFLVILLTLSGPLPQALAWGDGPSIVIDDVEGAGFNMWGPRDWGGVDLVDNGYSIWPGNDQWGGVSWGADRHWSRVYRSSSTYTDYQVGGEWRPNLPWNALYKVFVWIPWNSTSYAEYLISAADGPHWATIPQYASGNHYYPAYARNQWVYLGKFPFNAGTGGSVSLDNISPESWASSGFYWWHDPRTYSYWDARCTLWDAALFIPIFGDLTGTVFHDRNSNGQRDAGEEGVAGRQVILDGGASAWTDSAGNYTFWNRAPGTHRAEIRLGTNERATRRIIQWPNVVSEQMVRADFGISHYGKVTGTKFNDVDGDGARDPDDPGLGGWRISATPKKNGLLATYFDNTGASASPASMGLEITRRIDPLVDVDWSQGSPGAALPPDDFTARWEGYVSADTTGQYTFSTWTDDGVRLWVNGQLLINRWVDKGWSRDAASVLLLGGQKYRIKMEVYENGGWAAASLRWTKPGDITEQVIPSANLTPLESAQNTQNLTGRYEISGLLPGETYRVAENLLPDYEQTFPAAPGYYDLSIPEGLNWPGHSTTGAMDFGNRVPPPPAGKIKGIKFDDTNGNGWLDTGDESAEAIVAGWKITLTNLETSETTETSTNASGYYEFPDLEEAIYSVTEESRADWAHTTSETVIVDLHSRGRRVGVLTGTTTSGVEEKVDFGNVRLGDITVYKYKDRDFSKTKETSESTLPGWEIILKDIDDTTVATGTTGPDGGVKFDGLFPGTYRVFEVEQDHWQRTTDEPVEIILAEDGSETTYFGNIPLSFIEGVKYHDKNADGAQDPGEEELEGWTIELRGTDVLGQPVERSTVTGPDGSYKFNDLLRGEYLVNEVPQEGWRNTEYPDPAAPLALGAGARMTDIDFGNVKVASISGVKFDDINENGAKDEGEPLLPDWEISLAGTAINGESVETAVFTDDTGRYIFDGLLEGTYTVTETQKEGWINTLTPDTIYLPEGEASSNADFGNFKLGQISGHKWRDKNADGTWQEDSEVPLAGWEIKLTKPNGDEATTATDADGSYRFDGLHYGRHTVSETKAEGWRQTAPASGSHQIDVMSGTDATSTNFGNVKVGLIAGIKFNDIFEDGVRDAVDLPLSGWEISITGTAINGEIVNETTVTNAGGWFKFSGLLEGTYTLSENPQPGWVNTLAPAEVRLGEGEERYTDDFGNFKLGRASGYKWRDRNADGQWQKDVETGVENWPISLTMPDGTVQTTMTAADGFYEFTDLHSGEYSIGEANPAGWRQTSPSNQAYTFRVLSGAELAENDFGNVMIGSISGVKFDDLNENGAKDEGEPALPDWEISLAGTAINGESVETAVFTDDTGQYIFDGLLEGAYTVTETQKAGWANTAAPETVNLGEGENRKDADFGNFKLSRISGYKWRDKNADGIWQDTETPLAGWEIKLTKPNGEEATVTTGADGSYQFNALHFGRHAISEGAVQGWRQTTPPGGSHQIDVLSGTDATGTNFGNLKLGSISGIKFDDSNGNGIFDPHRKCSINDDDEREDSHDTSDTEDGHDDDHEDSDEGHRDCKRGEDYDEHEVAKEDDVISTYSQLDSDDASESDNLDTCDSTVASWRTFELTGLNVFGESVEATAAGDPATGRFLFKDLAPGEYSLSEKPSSAGVETNPDGSVLMPGWFNTISPAPFALGESEDATGKDFGNLWYGWIWGRVTDQYTGAPLADTTVTLGETSAAVKTNAGGYYYFYELEPNETTQFPGPNYTVMLSVPLDYLTHDAVNKFATVYERHGTRIDFTAYPEAFSAGKEPKTIGFWKHWSKRYSTAEIDALLSWVRATTGIFYDVSSANLSQKLTLTKHTSMRDKAAVQLLASWLNVASTRLGVDVVVDLSSVSGWDRLQFQASEEGTTTVGQLLTDINAYFTSGANYAKSIWESIKNILDELNNGDLFGG